MSSCARHHSSRPKHARRRNYLDARARFKLFFQAILIGLRALIKELEDSIRGSKKLPLATYVRARHMGTRRISHLGESFTLDEIPHAAIANRVDDPVHHLKYREAHGICSGRVRCPACAEARRPVSLQRTRQ